MVSQAPQKLLVVQAVQNLTLQPMQEPLRGRKELEHSEQKLVELQETQLVTLQAKQVPFMVLSEKPVAQPVQMEELRMQAEARQLGSAQA